VSGIVDHSSSGVTVSLDSTQWGESTRHLVGGTADLLALSESDIHQNPVNGSTCTISSDWAYKHVLGTDPHSVYVRKSYTSKGKFAVATGAGTIQGQSTGQDGYGVVQRSTETTGVNWEPLASAGFTEFWYGNTLSSAVTSKTCTHSLGVPPNIIQVTFREQGTNDFGRWWISQTTDSTAFILNVTNAPGVSNLDFYWYARAG
jgi:hypothetical protein